MSGDRYVISNQNSVYFLTLTVVDWIDLFTRHDYSLILVDSLNYCTNHKGLEIYAWIIMSSHAHIVAKANEPFGISGVLRDLKKYTSKDFVKCMNRINESRRNWLLNRFAFEAKRINRAENYKVWKDDNHAIEVGDYIDIEQKVNYVHDNPVKALIVQHAEDYYFSSAIDYAGGKGLVKIVKYY